MLMVEDIGEELSLKHSELKERSDVCVPYTSFAYESEKYLAS